MNVRRSQQKRYFGQIHAELFSEKKENIHKICDKSWI